MPTTRRTAGAGATAGKQSTLSFNHRVTKASVPVGKQAAKAAAASAPAKQSPLAKQIEDTVSAPTAADDEAVVEITPEDEAADGQAKVEDVVVAEEKDEEKSEAEVKALKMTDRQIETYWRDVEAERIAKRVHQEELGTPEKVLRYFDVSSQYGPCIGLTRLKRWQRAERLGLNPPVEVLAVLLKEEKKIVDAAAVNSKTGGGSGKGSKKTTAGSNKDIAAAHEPSKESVRLQTAHIDEILNSTVVGA